MKLFFFNYFQYKSADFTDLRINMLINILYHRVLQSIYDTLIFFYDIISKVIRYNTLKGSIFLH